MKKYLWLVLILWILALCLTPCFASDAMIEVDKSYQIKGWSVFASDDDIDATAETVTELDTTYAQLAAEDNLEVLSSAGGDTTQTVTVYGIDNSGDRISEEFSLSGATAQSSTNTFRYVDSVEVDAACAGTITVRRATGDTFIISIPIGSIEAGIVQHFNGEKDSYVTGFYASVNSTTNTISYELRFYPDDSSCLSDTTGYKVLDTIILTNVLGDSYHDLPNIKCPKGGWIVVYGTGGAANCSGAARIEGYDTN